MTGPDQLLAIDTATSLVVVVRGSADGAPLEAASWPAGYRHGETLLPSIERVLAAAGGRSSVSGIVVGTGPGAFTGLRVGIATAKGLAHGLGCPIVGVPTAAALLDAAATTGQGDGELVLLLPAGPTDRVVVRAGHAPERLAGGTEPDLPGGARVVAVDLEGRADDDATARGRAAHEGLGAALLRLGAARLRAGERDDLAELVPEYVTLPRGVTASAGEVEWSHDRR